jgi:hypothetical protein
MDRNHEADGVESAKGLKGQLERNRGGLAVTISGVLAVILLTGGDAVEKVVLVLAVLAGSALGELWLRH